MLGLVEAVMKTKVVGRLRRAAPPGGRREGARRADATEDWYGPNWRSAVIVFVHPVPGDPSASKLEIHAMRSRALPQGADRVGAGVAAAAPRRGHASRVVPSRRVHADAAAEVGACAHAPPARPTGRRPRRRRDDRGDRRRRAALRGRGGRGHGGRRRRDGAQGRGAADLPRTHADGPDAGRGGRGVPRREPVHAGGVPPEGQSAVVRRGRGLRAEPNRSTCAWRRRSPPRGSRS